VLAIVIGTIFGFTARQGGLSLIETAAFSAILFAGASQFAAVGLLAVAAPWASIVLLVWLLNARHFLYAASIAPHAAVLPRRVRAGLAFLLTDEAFALTSAHVARLGRIDLPGAWYAGFAIFVPWNLATLAGWLAGAALPDPATIGLDVVFPASMAGLAVGLVRDRAALAALAAGSAAAVGAALLVNASAAVMIGGLLGPLAGLVVANRSKGAQ
jgi:predicted branched-subunit amino acid permease